MVSTPTGTPTSPIPGVFVGVRQPTRNARTCRNSTPTNTGGPLAWIWGSSGRRFKSCQSDAGERLYLAVLNGDFRRRTLMKYPNEISGALR